MPLVYSKGNQVSLAIFIPPRRCSGCFSCIQSILSTEEFIVRACAWARASASSSPQGVGALWSQMWKTTRAPSAPCRWTQMPFHVSWPYKGLSMITYSLAFHCSSHGVNLFRTAQMPVQRINNQGSWENAKQAICWVPCFQASLGFPLLLPAGLRA